MNKTLTIKDTSGNEDTYPATPEQVSAALTALTIQQPDFPLRVNDTTTHYINMRVVSRLSVAAEEEAVSESDSEDTRTVAQLKVDLQEGGVEFDSSAKKADLLKLAQDNGL